MINPAEISNQKSSSFQSAVTVAREERWGQEKNLELPKLRELAGNDIALAVNLGQFKAKTDITGFNPLTVSEFNDELGELGYTASSVELGGGSTLLLIDWSSPIK